MELHTQLEQAFQVYFTGQFEQAKSNFQAILAQSPNCTAAYNGLALIAEAEQNWELAEHTYQSALACEPNDAESHNNLGILLQKMGKIKDALFHFGEALRFNPHYLLHYNIALLLEGSSKPTEALHHYEQAVQYQPNFIQGWQQLGALAMRLGVFTTAVTAFYKLVALQPENSQPYLHLGELHEKQGQYHEAILCYQTGLKLAHHPVSFWKRLIHCHIELCQHRQAIDYAEKCLEQEPSDLHRLRLIALLPPPIYKQQAEWIYWRTYLENQVEQLLAKTLQINPAEAEINTIPFYLAYQGQNDRELNCKIAALYRQLLPEYLPVATRPDTPTPHPIRLGFVSRNFWDHSVSHCFFKAIAAMPQADFELFLFVTAPMEADGITEAYKKLSHHFFLLEEDLEVARRLIAEQVLDILVYTDIGMEPFSYFLAFSRLAPVQCALSGHPVTTGIPTVDYFISSELLEGPDAQQHYSETLVKLSDVIVHYPKPSLPQPLKSRSALGLPEQAHLYVFPMTLFKLHPDFDAAIAGILRRDPFGVVLLFQHKGLEVELMARFERTIPDVLPRLHWRAWTPRDDFLQILAQADVILDSFHFGAGNTAYLAFAVGTPMVTWPAKYLRGRVCSGFYQQMGISDCIAHSLEEYVAIASRLGTEPDYRQMIRETILARHDILYENNRGIAELIQFFRQIAKLQEGKT